jgi:hypothetical protein
VIFVLFSAMRRACPGTNVNVNTGGDDDDFLAKDGIKQPTVYDFDKCRTFTPEMDNRSEEEDKVEVHVVCLVPLFFSYAALRCEYFS